MDNLNYPFGLKPQDYENVEITKTFSYRKMKRGTRKVRAEDGHLKLTIPVTAEQITDTAFYPAVVKLLPPQQAESLPEMKPPQTVEAQAVDKVDIHNETDKHYQLYIRHPDLGTLDVIPESGMHLKQVIVEHKNSTPEFKLVIMAKRVGHTIMGEDLSPDALTIGFEPKSAEQLEREAAQAREEAEAKAAKKAKSNKDQLSLADAKPMAMSLRQTYTDAALDELPVGHILALSGGDIVKVTGAKCWKPTGSKTKLDSIELLQVHGDDVLLVATQEAQA